MTQERGKLVHPVESAYEYVSVVASSLQKTGIDEGVRSATFDPKKSNISSMFWATKKEKRNGTVALKFGFSDPIIVNKDSQVCVSLTECSEDGTPVFSEAVMSIYNVVPTVDGGVIVRFNVAWSTPLDIKFNFIIAN